MFALVPLMNGIVLSRNPVTLASRGNPASYDPVDGRDNRSSALTDWKL